MPKLTKAIPKYRRHRGSGQAVVTLSGTDHYLGPYRSKASRLEYDRLISEWIQNGRSSRCQANDATIVEVASAYLRHARAYYVKNGRPTANGYAKSFFSRLRDELLNCEEFANLAEARWFAKRRIQEHNQERPHSSLGCQTPSEFASQLAVSAPVAATPKPPLQQPTAASVPQPVLITPGTEIGGTPPGNAVKDFP